jgi:hypothetical protein
MVAVNVALVALQLPRLKDLFPSSLTTLLQGTQKLDI